MNKESNQISKIIKTLHHKSHSGKSLKQFARALSLDTNHPDSELATQWFKNKKPQPKVMKLKIKKNKSKD